ncbi:hypothetical protein RvY_05714 [Ramazzottius varieornatus]|uniref:Anillin homology domain-containing protein n=1 Tax=Ramazzottius varieornatus TaxID=947166 RepID=A0A1D1UZ08_RAMVA|nr:hypothetical protein RvY_05714 [Ramazzottius varieornatus]
MESQLNGMSSRQSTRQKSRNATLPPKLPKGRLLITEIRLPFVWKERQYFKDRSHKADNYGKKFVVFCILYTDQDMQSTQKVMVDSSMADVVFPELIEFSNITPTTLLHIEVFSYACSSGSEKTISPVRKLSRKLTRSLTRTFGRRYASSAPAPWTQSASIHFADLHAGEYGQQLPITSLPNFTKIAENTLSMKDLISGEEGRSHILSIRNALKGSTKRLSTAYEVPLFGSFACRTAVQPYCAIKEIQIGRIHISEVKMNGHSSRTTAGAFYYCTLVNSYLYCYNSDRDRRLLEMAIRVDKSIKITKRPEEMGIELNTQAETFLLRFASDQDRRAVTNILREHMNELAQWDEAALTVRDLKLKPNAAKTELRRRGSLYDEIPITNQQLRFQNR